VLRQLDPSRVVPTRVRQALDALAEGLLVLDHDERIVLANRSIRKTLECDENLLLGRRASEIPWVAKGEDGQPVEGDSAAARPWQTAMQGGETQRGVLMGLALGSSKNKTFVVNATPICDEGGVRRGVLTSFEDVTPLERKKMELMEALTKVRTAAEHIREQNRELERLATRDPLTGAFNRRSFYEQFSVHWDNSKRYKHPLACVMVDVDHFKSVNDNHGHAAGDQVLQKVAAELQRTARRGDIVARYGGEEFAILLTHTDLAAAEEAAEKFRLAIEALRFPNLQVTASLGVSELSLEPASMEQLLDQADRGLYAAKRTGRNRTVRFDRIPANLPQDDGGRKSRKREEPSTTASTPIPFPAVTALISALAYRDSATAEHSRRVADMCAMVAEGLVSASDCYVIEIGALLHDIGKIGVPDHILLKPGALTRDEWQIMEKHDRIGVEIIRASFSSELLSGIVEYHHAFFGGGARHKGLPTGLDIPIGARVLAIADAYDAMVSDRVYRKGRAPAEAFVELRRCAGTQFDPELVERFIGLMQDRIASATGVVPQISKEAALSIGLQLERLALAVDQLDLPGLRALAGRLQETAAKERAPEIAAKAMELELAVNADADAVHILRLAGQLMHICRQTQTSYLRDSDGDLPAESFDEADADAELVEA
jgi:diguanylate cyclase (GGDEF)-like protein/putative nucleotidyltransferase with HDIG domain